MVRVSLSPVVVNKNGKVTGVSGNSGIFADCLNIWRLGKVVKHHAKTPGHKTTTKKHRRHLDRKIASQDAHARGHAPIGGGRNKTKGPGKYQKPSQVTKPTSTPRVNPTTPAASPSATPGSSATPTPEVSPSPTPTPEASGTATGNVDIQSDAITIGAERTGGVTHTYDKPPAARD